MLLQLIACFHRLRIISVAVFVLLISALALADMPPPEKLDPTGFRELLAKSGKVYISGQPEEGSFAKLQEKGVTTVINLRTQPEMDNREAVPFDEKAVVEGLGLDYVHIPLGGPDTPYTPAALEKFARTVEEAEGDVLLHCTVAWRASHMWASYLVKYHGLSPDEAIAQARDINFGRLPIEKMLDRTISLK